MPVFVILALALAVLAAAAAGLAVAQVMRAAGGLDEAVRDTTRRLRPLLDELQQEVAVTGHELEALGAPPGQRGPQVS